MKLPSSVGIGDLVQGVGGGADLTDVEDRVALGGGDLAVLQRHRAGVGLLQALLGPDEDLLGVVLGHQEVGERAGRDAAVGGDRQVVLRRVLRTRHRGADDLVDRLLLGVAGAVPVVGEGGLRGQQDGVDHEQHQHQGAGHEVLRRERPPGGVGRHQDRGDDPDRGQEHPRALADEHRRQGDRDADHDAEEQDLDDQCAHAVPSGLGEAVRLLLRRSRLRLLRVRHDASPSQVGRWVRSGAAGGRTEVRPPVRCGVVRAGQPASAMALLMVSPAAVMVASGGLPATMAE